MTVIHCRRVSDLPLILCSRQKHCTHVQSLDHLQKVGFTHFKLLGYALVATDGKIVRINNHSKDDNGSIPFIRFEPSCYNRTSATTTHLRTPHATHIGSKHTKITDSDIFQTPIVCRRELITQFQLSRETGGN
jgi:hypothetical protein